MKDPDRDWKEEDSTRVPSFGLADVLKATRGEPVRQAPYSPKKGEEGRQPQRQ